MILLNKKKEQNTAWSRFCVTMIESLRHKAGGLLLPETLATSFTSKTWMTRKRLVPASRAMEFPNITVEEVLGSKPFPIQQRLKTKKVTLLNVFMTMGDELQGQQWERAFLEEFGKEKRCQHLRLACYEGKVLNWQPVVEGTRVNLKKMFEEMNEEERPPLLLNFDQDWITLRKEIGMMKIRPNHVLLIDGSGRIRWTASEKCVSDDAEIMVKMTEQLLSE